MDSNMMNIPQKKKINQWIIKEESRIDYKPAAHSQYEEWEYIGGRIIAIRGIIMQGTNWTAAYRRRSSKNLQNNKHQNLMQQEQKMIIKELQN